MTSDTSKVPPSSPVSLPINLLTPLDVAELLGKSERWVREQCAAKLMPATKFGISYRITVADLDQYIAANRLSS